MYHSVIRGTGSYLPPKKLTNQDLEKLVDTNDDWIKKRTGIESRSIAEDGVLTSDLALEASKEALEQAKLTPKNLDMIIVATTSPDTVMPNTACILQHKLQAPSCLAFDLYAACTGWIYGVSIADQFIKTGTYKNILVVGSEILHHLINYKDRNTCVLFGDGAGAGIISRSEETDKGIILSSHLHCDGSLGHLLVQKAGGVANPVSQKMIDDDEQFLTMNGREIFKNAVRAMVKSSKEAMEANKVTSDDIDWVIPHQANLRIMDATTQNLGIDPKKIICELADMGNISAASIPRCLNKAIKDGRIQRGQLILITAFGGGLTSGSILFRY